MRYTISAPIKKKKRRRISVRRVASPKAAAGLVTAGLATIYRSLGVRNGCPESIFKLAAGCLDGRPRALGRRYTLEGHGLLDLTGQDDLGALGMHWDHARIHECRQVDDRRIHLGEFVQPHFGARGLDVRAKAGLGQAPLQRHLATLETDLVVAALARALALDAAAAGLALSRRCAAAHAQAWTLGAPGGFHGVQTHVHFSAFSTLSRCFAVSIRPRFCGVSSTSTV